MIRPADESEILSLRQLWNDHYGKTYTDVFFERYLREGDIFVYEEDGKILSFTALRSFPLVLHHEVIKVSFIQEPAGEREEDRKKLLDAVVDMCSHTELVSIARKSKLFEEEGFTKILTRKWKVYGPSNTFREVSSVTDEELLEIYASSVEDHDFYRLRNEKDFREKREIYQALGGTVFAVKRNGIPKAYAFVQEEDGKIFADEIFSSDEDAYRSLIDHLRTFGKILYVTERVGEEIRDEIVMRINDEEMFRRVYPEAFTIEESLIALLEDY